MSQTTDNMLKNLHPLSFKGIFKNYTLKKMVCNWAFGPSLVITIVCEILLNNNLVGRSTYDLLVEIIDFSISLFPNLLGFNLGGYALLIGFGNTKLLKSLIDPDPANNNISVLQEINGVFAFAILLEAVALIASILANFFLKLQVPVIISDTSIIWVNSIVLFLELFLCLWAIFIVPYMIANVFTFGQLHHFYLTTNSDEDPE